MSRLGALFGRVGATLAGPPYARYHAWGGELADVEIGFPLTRTSTGWRRDRQPGRRGRGVRAARRPRGADDPPRPIPALGDAYSSLHDWIHAQGYDEGDGPWETYIDNPEEVADVAQLRTEITWPVPDR